MSCRVIYLAGVPASGKTAIFREVRNRLQLSSPFKFGLCRGVTNGRTYMLGVFDGSTFEGTDKLAMNCINDCIRFVNMLNAGEEQSVLFVEGDRLLNERFLRETLAELIVIQADAKTLASRHASRMDTQSVTFLKGRATKVENLANKFNAIRLRNVTEVDFCLIVESLVGFTK